MPMFTPITHLILLASTQGVGAQSPGVDPAPSAEALPGATGLDCVPAPSSAGVCNLKQAGAPPEAEQATEASKPGDIVVTAGKGSRAIDPLRGANEKSFEVVSAVDDAVVGPVALTYKRLVPRPLRDGVRNFLNNLHEPVVALNFLIQLKPGKAVETIGRFGVNSTAGIAGLFDVARRRPINLPRRMNGFADSMGYYGVRPGPYLFLPLIGPTTVRDLLGGTLDGFVLPFAVGRPFNRVTYTLPTAVLRGLDRRAEFDAKLVAMRDGGGDLYATRRSRYLGQRQAEIDALRGRTTQPQ